MKHLAFLFLPILIVASSCNFMGGKRVSGNGNVTTSEKTVSSFTEVEQKGSFDVYVSTGSTYTVKIEAEDNLIPYIETNVNNGKLEINSKKGFWLQPTKSLKVYITAPTFSAIRSYGSGNITSENTIYDSSKIELSVSGSADIKATVDAPEVHSDVTGSGNADLNGQTRKFDGNVRGSGNINAFNLKAEEAKVEISGSGNANLFASVKLDVTVNGSGDVSYKGSAPQVVSNMHGSGTLKKVE